VGYNIPTSNDFKAQFIRDFRYAVPGYGAVVALTVAGGVITAAVPQAGGYNYPTGTTPLVITDVSGTGAVINGTFTAGSLISCAIENGGAGYSSNAQAIPSGGDNTNQGLVTDTDINGAISDASDNMDQGLFPNQQIFTRAFLFLAAHCLVENLLASVEGLASQFSWLTGAKSVDGVSQSFVIPDRIKDDPFLSLLSTTRYGARYLQITMPYTVGHVATLLRETNPV
jgi:hypothetical protein